jgi:hypothetical protein
VPAPESPFGDLTPENALLSVEREILRRGRLEQVLEVAFGTEPSSLQRAICRAADGLPVGDILTDEEIGLYFGCARSLVGTETPRLVVVIAGIRSGKSLIASMAQVTRAMTVDLTSLKPHIVPRIRIICPKSENAHQTFAHILGAIDESPGLRSCMAGDPKFSPYPQLHLARSDGRQIQISIGAADSGGLSMRSGWLAGFVLDEAALFGESSTGAAVNAEEILEAAETRLLPGAQGWIVSSPYGPTGLLYQLYASHWGRPGRVVVVRAPTLAMNPHFPPADLEAIRREKPDVAAREYDAEWIDADSAFYEGLLIDRAVRAEPGDVLPQDGSRYLAAMDAGMRGNAWTLVIARDVRDRYDQVAKIEISLAIEWVGSRQSPLDPGAVLENIKALVKPYGVVGVNCDHFAIDPLTSIASKLGVALNAYTFRGEEKVGVYRSVDALLRQGRLSLPNMPAVVRDLKGVRRRISAGRTVPFLPQTSDGRHCDFAPSLSLACWLLSGEDFARDLDLAMTNVREAGGPGAYFGAGTRG